MQVIIPKDENEDYVLIVNDVELIRGKKEEIIDYLIANLDAKAANVIIDLLNMEGK
jgi:hypothetical protein